MPAYEIPPWLRPADTVGPYVQGLHLGAQLAQERQRLAAQASEAATRAALQQQQMEQESMLAQQRMEVMRAQAQQEIGLKQQALEQRQQQVQMATEQAARKYAAMQAYQQEVTGGGDPLKAILKYGPAMGQQTSAEAAAIRASQIKEKPPLPTEVRGVPVLTPEGQRVPGMLGLPSATGGLTVRDLPKTGDELSVNSAAMLLRELPRIDAMAGVDPTATNSLSATLGPDLRKKVLSTVKRAQPAAADQTSAVGPVAVAGEPPKVTNKAEFDALPSGTVYIGKDGRKYKKS